MEEIGLIGGGFQHAYSSTLWKKPKNFTFIKNEERSTTFYVDDGLINSLGKEKCKNPIGWVLESRDVHPGQNDFIIKNSEQVSKEYDYVFTHNRDIFDLAENFVYIPSHGYWIEDPKIYEKTKLVSMMSSNKGMTRGHRFRLMWAEKLKDKVDLFGRGFKEVEKKEEALKDYMFSVTMENDRYSNYWTEKILDCFATGTVPIYFGSPDIFDHFNKDGIILLDQNFDVSKLSKEEYIKRLPAIKDNFERCLEFDVIEDIIYDKWIKKG